MLLCVLSVDSNSQCRHSRSATFPSLGPKGSNTINQSLDELPGDFKEIMMASIQPTVWMSHNKRWMVLPRPCRTVCLKEKTACPHQLPMGDLT